MRPSSLSFLPPNCPLIGAVQPCPPDFPFMLVLRKQGPSAAHPAGCCAASPACYSRQASCRGTWPCCLPQDPDLDPGPHVRSLDPDLEPGPCVRNLDPGVHRPQVSRCGWRCPCTAAGKRPKVSSMYATCASCSWTCRIRIRNWNRIPESWRWRREEEEEAQGRGWRGVWLGRQLCGVSRTGHGTQT